MTEEQVLEAELVEPPRGEGPSDPAVPSRGLARVGSSARGLATDTFQNFVAGDLESGVIRVRGLGAPMATLVVASSAVFFALIGIFLTNQTWRSRYALVSLGREVPGRGSFVPAAAVMPTYFLLAFSLALVLAGAAHIVWWARIAVVTIYLAIGSTMLTSTTGPGASSAVAWGGRAALLAVPIFFVAVWRARPRPAFEFCVLFALVATAFGIGLHQFAVLDRVSSNGFSAQLAATFMFALAALLGPRLVMAGVDTVSFGASVSLWVLGVLDRHVHALATTLLLVGFGAWRFRDTVVETHGRLHAAGAEALARSLLGGLVLLLLVAATWWAFDAAADRYEGEEQEDPDVVAGTKRLALPLGAIYLGIITTLGIAALVAGGVDAQQTGTGWAPSMQRLLGRYETSFLPRWEPLIWSALAVVAGAIIVRRRGGRLVALVLAEIGVVGIWMNLTTPNRLFSWFDPDSAGATDPWFVLVAVGLAIAWAWQRRLDHHRAARLLFVLLLAGLVKQADFIGNPFKLVLGFAGVGFVAFGLVWGYLTAGGWANATSRAFPRTGRILLFLGYTIFTLTVAIWFTLAHDLDSNDQVSSQWAGLGQRIFGQPMLLSLIVVTLVGGLSGRMLLSPPAPTVAENETEGRPVLEADPDGSTAG
jgi:hypothetical protein